MRKTEDAKPDSPHILKFLVLARELCTFSSVRSLDKVTLTSQRHRTEYRVFCNCLLRDLLAMSLPLETFDSPASNPGFIFHLPIQVKLCTKSREIQSPPLERSTERNSVMANRYELSDEAWGAVSDLFIETHGRGRPRLSDRLMLDGVLWVFCSGAAW
ncbi:hypothetical protein D3C76_97580 [compost metagenome]